MTLAASAAVAVAGVQAQTVVDFESFNLGGATFLDTPQTMNFINVGNTNVDMTILGHDDLRVYDLAKFNSGGGGYASPGPQALIDMNWNTYSNPKGTDIVFSQGVSNFSLIAGDFGSDADTSLRIEAFGSSGNSLGISTAIWSNSAFPPFAKLSLNVNDIFRVHYSSGGPYANSTFIDDITFTATAVPEPEAYAMMLAGLGLMGSFARRRKAKQTA